MLYYQFHINDFRSGSVGMSELEELYYRRMLDEYYAKEQALPLEVDKLCRQIGARSQEARDAVAYVLESKFMKTDAGHENSRCERVLAEYDGYKADKSAAGKASAAARAAKRAAAVATAAAAGNNRSTGDEHPSNDCATAAQHPPNTPSTESNLITSTITKTHSATDVADAGASGELFGKKDDSQPGEQQQTPTAELWSAGVSLLEEAGVPKPQCRSVIGKYVRDYGEPVVREAVRAGASRPPTADPRAWLTATCQHLKGARVPATAKPSRYNNLAAQDYSME
ncbi:YdaU family protein [Paraburkholderia sp. SEWSISQ10-3 4]|uniref:YdaU family protein n=1 Tax=Paraburkholderia TaxID=1822464 RepID=UPI00224E1198|nr:MULTISPECIES: YdaU family protein [Paraburkholderia]MCX4137883.1 YdaU family protein [Paraburkholderia aspalathi]MDN7170574.1 YdaU family protein [Paraburkholderia sp. SEWSISQ10-3 4]MDQ6500213.1 YdaU family protein [Paraburkholderia aspalathi]